MPDRFLKVLIPDGEVNGDLIFSVVKDDGTEYDPYYVKLSQISTFIGGGGGGVVYSSYVAQLTQTGTDAPVATVLQNDLGGTVVWTRNGTGDYSGTLAGAFIEDKTHIPPFSTIDAVNGVFMPLWDQNGVLNGYYSVYRVSVNAIQLIFTDDEGNFVDMSTLLSTSKLSLPEIRVYP